MKNIQKLTLVFVKSLYLHIKDGTGINLDAVMLGNILSQTDLVAVLDIHKLLLCLLVLRIDLHLCDVRQIGDPLVSDMLRHPVCKQWVAMQEESSLCDAVSLVVELLRHHFVEILQLLLLQDLRMQSCHTVYGIACHDCQTRHVYLSVVHDRHLTDLLLIAGILLLYLL